MTEIVPSIDVYNIEIEVLSPICVSGAGDDGKTDYESFEYVIDSNKQKIYFIDDNDLLKFLSIGFIKQNDLDLEYSELIRKILSRPEIETYVRSLNISCKCDNKLKLKRFARIKEINLNNSNNEKIIEKYIIPGSTIKGMLRTGFIARKIEKNMDEVNKKQGFSLDSCKNDDSEKFYEDLFEITDYEIQINNTENDNKAEENWISLQEYNKKAKNDENMEFLSKEKIFNILFQNIVCCDFELIKGEVAVEKAVRIDRRIHKNNAKKKKIPVYFEAAQPGTKFSGQIRYKNDTGNYDKQLSLVSIQTRDPLAPNPVIEALEGLKIMSRRIIKNEYSLFYESSSIKNSDIKTFYDMLQKENDNEGIVVFKIGYSGIWSKSWMVFNDKKIKFMPYTILASEKRQIPMGWIKIKYDF